MAIKKYLRDSSGLYIRNGSNYIYKLLTTIPVVPGGTATGVEVTQYTKAEETTIKQDAITAGVITSEELDSALVINITGTTPGTIILDVSDLGNEGDFIKLVHQKADTTWETVFTGAIPASKQITITLSSFSPIIGVQSTPEYLCFTATLAGSSVELLKVGTPNISNTAYSRDCITWTTFTPGASAGTNKIILANIGDKVYFKNNINANFTTSKHLKFNMMGRLSVSGNCNSIYSADNFASLTTLVYEYCYYSLFMEQTAIYSAPSLPATTLSAACYWRMFYGCTNLTATPNLPATVLTEACYREMFNQCTSLTRAPALPATTLSAYSYYCMFCGCSSLTTPPASIKANDLPQNSCACMFYNCRKLTSTPTFTGTGTAGDYACDRMFMYDRLLRTPPVLKFRTAGNYAYNEMFEQCGNINYSYRNYYGIYATTVGDYCCKLMFNNCASLENAPSLPATTLGEGCYSQMFYQSGLTQAPTTLPATTLAVKCYSGMFQQCPITTAPTLPATTLAPNCYVNMFHTCAYLTASPALPATTVANYSYYYMFYQCTQLTTIATISATTLGTESCSGMFKSCTSLTTPPVLSATSLGSSCYNNLFQGCTSLTSVPNLPATTYSSGAYSYMFYGCTSLQISDTQTSSATYAWVLPSDGTFSNTVSERNVFYRCAGSRSSNDLTVSAGQSKTYYTQNPPVS